ncbi:MAG: 30S ribosomal protein S3 [Candidatus Sericytochromatia bacterium]|nr:30S ribosomal protein S3 [Candidatus Tanganyikabacteria bacterium]
MGQKIHPYGLRLGIIKPWRSRWFAGHKDYRLNLVEDRKIREHIKSKLYSAGIADIQIERKSSAVTVFVTAAKPGVVVGRGGAGIEALRKELAAMTGKKVHVDTVEVKNPDIEAQLVAESIAAQLEKRVAFRRAIKLSIQRTMKAGAQGVKVMVAGRLGGAEIARTEWQRDGRIPLHTLRADIDYGVTEARTMAGVIGIKVWVYKGEVLPQQREEKGGTSRAHA